MRENAGLLERKAHHSGPPAISRAWTAQDYSQLISGHPVQPVKRGSNLLLLLSLFISSDKNIPEETRFAKLSCLLTTCVKESGCLARCSTAGKRDERSWVGR